MEQVLNKAEQFIKANGTTLQKTVLDYLKGSADKLELVGELERYQNDDGGWAHGIEAEYQGDISSPMSTAAALGYIYLFYLKDTKLFENTIKYLHNTQKENGSFDDVDDIRQFDIPQYMGPEIYVDYKTGMIVKWLRRISDENSQLIDRAVEYLVNVFDDVKQKNDMWSAVAYANVFGESPEHPDSQRILDWAMKVLSPDGKIEEQQLPWMKVQGMIYDDHPLIVKMKEKVYKSIKENQLEDGSWPHPFGTYNQVWVAILIIRLVSLLK